MKGEENKKEKLECRKRIKCMKKLSWISLRVSPFYRELQNIFMDDHPQITIVVHNLIFYNTPPWMIIKICLIKTLLGKTLWKKTLVKEKEYNILLDYYNCLVKNLTSKTHWDKTWTKEKECSISILSFSPSCKHDYNFFNISNGRSLNFRIPKSYLNFF